MKIKFIKIYFLEKKIIKTEEDPKPTFYNKGFVFIELITSDGISGLGEPSPYIETPKKLQTYIKDIYFKYFKDRELESINITNIKNKITNIYLKSLLSSFEQCIYDILGKYNKKPVWKILNNNIKISPVINLYASGGMIFDNKKYDSLYEEALLYKDQGFVGWKFRPKMPSSDLSHKQRLSKPPSFDLKDLVNFSVNLRKEVGDDFHLMLDCGGRLKELRDIEYLIEALSDLNFFFLEEPFPRNINKYLKIKKLKIKNSIPISAGEHFSCYDQFLKWNKNKCIDIYQPDTNLLLFNEIKKIYQKTQSNCKKVIMHNWCNLINNCSNFMITVSLDAKILVEYNVVKTNVFHEMFLVKSFKIIKGKAKILNTPGLGVDILKNKSKNVSLREKKY
jgi:L-alanine-DL-glutamate epimerase-like enolase superfamily enzyme